MFSVQFFLLSTIIYAQLTSLVCVKVPVAPAALLRVPSKPVRVSSTHISGPLTLLITIVQWSNNDQYIV